ncbi:RsmB/NOP family class I SAM-dependent RNA methyltransferase [Asticcacaulis sp. YBE204]|uniref:RsmB/NOP family class I SAM-dependent RNA methyltransferase n=1 Tax=Asticcacaulis sp. YBE204 TaxID=1282363 RepID=UPI0003C3BACD|nr:RsmB/NOP family class I SAM-dependent RNA methyltransferase [Asticcacaulis sp. YBE204]ESQ80824.1 rRNA methyltransferase [Asticcacaulis sp. YBE204]
MSLPPKKPTFKKPAFKKAPFKKPPTGDRPIKAPKPAPDESMDNDIGLNARLGALKLIEAALDHRGGFDEAGSTAEFLQLSDSERAFARALALLVLRRLGHLDHIIHNKTQKMPPEAVRALLRIGMAQIFFMQVPDFAAVSTTVKIAERDNKTRPFKGLINAILRGLIREGGLRDVNPKKLMPDWLWQRWLQTYGEDNVAAMANVLTEEPATDLSFRNSADRDRLLEKLEGEAIGELNMRSGLRGDLRHWAEYEDGLWWVQDIAAATPVNLLGDLTGKTALDVCAAPGGKTLQLVAKGASVVAIDRSKNRLKRVEENLKRLGMTAEIHNADAASFDDPRTFDVVLVDAPCSATGTYRRQPDVLWGSKPADVAKLADVQHRLLDALADRVAPDGDLVYCTCSLEREEGETQILAFLRRNKAFTLVKHTPDQHPDIPAASIAPEGWLRLLPHQRKGGQDGFFIAHLKRNPV